MKTPKHFVVLGSFLCLVLVGAEQAARKVVSLDKVMTKEDQRRTGVSKFSAEERAALEEWLGKFAIDVAATVNKKEGTYVGVGQRHWIKDVIDRGAIIRLEDGSLWEISALDKIDTMLWLPIDDITIVENKSPLYPYKLINSREAAEAKLISQ